MLENKQSKLYEYTRRKPESSVLYKVVQNNIHSFFNKKSSLGVEYPRFIHDTFKKYLTCGILEYGFIRCYCKTCKCNILVAHSCKSRGFCPSCYGRKQQEESIFLGKIIPNYPVRQWVLSLPYNLRFVIANNPQLTSRVLGIFIRSVHAWYKLKARRMGYKDTVAGSITFIQRATSALALSPHFHTLMLDGVYYRKDDQYFFLSVGSPTKYDLQKIVDRILNKSQKLFSDLNDFPNTSDLFETVKNGVGQIKILDNYMAVPKAEFIENDRDPYSAKSEGFSLNARVVIKKDKREKLEKLIRYVARGPVALGRLKEVSGGVSYELKKTWNNGATHVVFSYESFIQRLIALIPPKKAHQIRFHGLFGPNFKDRDKILSKNNENSVADTTTNNKILWADLIKLTYNIDVTVCRNCAGRLEPIANIKNKKVAIKILESLKLMTIIPIAKSGIDPPNDDTHEIFIEVNDQRPSDW